MLQTLRSRRRPFATLALVATLALLLLVAVPGARPAHAVKTGHDYTFYSDASHSTVVGYQFWCIGYHGGWGVTSQYLVVGDYPCT